MMSSLARNPLTITTVDASGGIVVMIICGEERA